MALWSVQSSSNKRVTGLIFTSPSVCPWASYPRCWSVAAQGSLVIGRFLVEDGAKSEKYNKVQSYYCKKWNIIFHVAPNRNAQVKYRYLKTVVKYLPKYTYLQSLQVWDKSTLRPRLGGALVHPATRCDAAPSVIKSWMRTVWRMKRRQYILPSTCPPAASAPPLDILPVPRQGTRPDQAPLPALSTIATVVARLSPSLAAYSSLGTPCRAMGTTCRPVWWRTKVSGANNGGGHFGFWSFAP